MRIVKNVVGLDGLWIVRRDIANVLFVSDSIYRPFVPYVKVHVCHFIW
jgi:hypothetical protein